MRVSNPTSTHRPAAHRRGFALVISLMLMTLLSVLAVAFLSLSHVSLRTAHRGEARRVASANARMALTLALGQLQSELGDDRRVTADGAIVDPRAGQPHLVGAWDSIASNHTASPLDKAPDYTSWKENHFRGWLVSHPDASAPKRRNFAKYPALVDAPLLFSERADGFEIKAPSLPVESRDGMAGRIAWAVSQEATKAKINVGTDRPRVAGNDELQAPTRPNLGLSGLASQPTGGEWNLRSARVVNPGQAFLDGSYQLDRGQAVALGREHGASALGLLVDVVKGGLKTDMSLGFELDDDSFRKHRWADIRNPFAEGSAPGGEVPLFTPINGGGPVAMTMNYGSVSNYTHSFKTGSAPTFQSLRSHYQLYHHAYESGGLPSVFYRPQSSSFWPESPAPRGSETSVAPVLDRVLFFISFCADANGILNVVFTPVVTLWNPYNTAIEADGFTVFPWMDMPIFVNWTINGTNQGSYVLSHLMGADKTRTLNGRQAEPYFLCNLTATGTKDTSKPIHLGPGEVRVFVPTDKNLTLFKRLAPEKERTIGMRPVDSAGDLDVSGGFRIRMTDGMGASLSHVVQSNDEISAQLNFSRNNYHYFVTMEDAGRMKGEVPQVVSEIQVSSGKLANQIYTTPVLSGRQLKVAPQPVALLETFHRTAGQAGQLADLVFTVNPRQRYVNALVSGASGFASGPHYESSMRLVRDFVSEAFQTTTDGRRSFYGSSNAPSTGRDHLSFYEIPREPMLSLAAFQHADLVDSAFSPGSQFANAWASPYVARTAVARLMRTASGPGGERIQPSGLGVYDHSYLLNAALWDGFYFSSIAPETELAAAGPSRSSYENSHGRIVRPTADVVRKWVEDPVASPLRNPRHLLHDGGVARKEIADLLLSPAGCRHASAHLMVDGAFNVNSVNEAAWRAVLTSLRGTSFTVESGSGTGRSYTADKATPAPRLRRPIGSPDDLWNGFRELSDDEIRKLAAEIVQEVRDRGPFQSLGEFVNRRLSNDTFGLKGALQAAIDRADINKGATVAKFVSSGYPYPSNLPDPFTGTGTPGWLTQADLLNTLGPVITVRSDTFTVRGYGESCDADGKVIARAWCESVVQRVPEWIDAEDPAVRLPADLTPTSARFGRRFEILSFRELSREELDA